MDLAFAKRAPSTRPEAGFTLIEVTVVIAMVGVLSAGAVLFVKPSAQAATARGYAQQIVALCSAMQQRAFASRTYQRLEVQEDQVIHWQATTPGMDTPTEWALIGTVPVPSEVTIASVSDRTHIEPDDDVPDLGDGLPAAIDFAPDGEARSATIFVTDAQDRRRARVAIYRVTGSAFAYSEW